MTNTEPAAPKLGHAALFLKFLRFGCLAFGGPVAQIAMVRQALVEEERWISPARFNRLLAVMQALPGPEAHELCVHMGMLARGRIGGLLAGLGFMLPGLLLMLLAAWAYAGWIAGQPDVARIFLGIQVAVLAVIARAVMRIGQHVLEDRLLWLLAIASFAATLLSVPFWLPLVAAGLCASLAGRPALMIAAALGAVIVAVLLGPVQPNLLVSAGATAGSLALFFTGLKGGLLTFGGAYTAIPYVRTDTVERGWLTDGAFLDGVALAGILPAPLVIFATFAGYVVGGFGGALAITAGMFLPAFAFSLIFFERLEAIAEHPALHRFLGGVAAAVVGTIAATLIELGHSTAMRVETMPIALLTCAAAFVIVWRVRSKLAIPGVLLLGGAVGWFFF
jgi:chromate transporter